MPQIDSSLYHLVQRHIWEAAKACGEQYVPPTYPQDGFVHLTRDPAFLLGIGEACLTAIGNHFYRDVPGDYLLLVLDPAKLTAKVVYEAAAPVGNVSSAGLLGEAPPLFPHLYGVLDHGAVLQELLVERNASGQFISIIGLEA